MHATSLTVSDFEGQRNYSSLLAHEIAGQLIPESLTVATSCADEAIDFESNCFDEAIDDCNQSPFTDIQNNTTENRKTFYRRLMSGTFFY